MLNFNVVTHTQDALGEGPIWVARDECLYWVDMTGRRLHRYRPANGAVSSWSMPQNLCWVVERAGHDGLLAGFATGMATITLDPLTVDFINALDPGLGNRLNDAKVDPRGRLWAGTMEADAASPTGHLCRMDDLTTARVLDSEYLVPNGPAFSPTGDFIYHADSLRRVVYRFTVATDGTLYDKRRHIVFDGDTGLPDGMTVDAEGYLWIGHWDGGRISRFDPDGRLDRAVALPASRITSCAFGGTSLDRLFVTSARAEREGEPLAGALFELQPGVCGIAAVAFNG